MIRVDNEHVVVSTRDGLRVVRLPVRPAPKPSPGASS